ncbi:hypothetical protein H2201_001162 [Coniosporium apollinis]|uniref:Trafficking protein particle complex II-specific subunit 65 IgD3 domain-containing protein n=1 Tax=Coniosporium apollinis TaxID=61459 RepID=A0ABQ9P1N6_9PEZI|nr:hypothetical protein H2201_001162 [Coniosporium apollinis]
MMQPSNSPEPSSAEFGEQSIVEAFVPSDPSINLEHALNSWDGSASDRLPTFLPTIQQRQSLFFVPVQTETGESRPAQAHQSKELLCSEKIEDVTSPLLITQGPSEGKYTYVVWRANVHVGRPQAKLQKPVVYFAVTATLRPDEAEANATQDDYLPSHTPMPINLLQAFASDPELRDARPHLSASRITKVIPAGHGSNTSVRTLQASPRRQFRICPAIYWRIRYSRLHSGTREVTVLASLDLEVTLYAECDVSISDVRLMLQDGEAVPYGGSWGPKLPVRCRAGDLLSLVYKLRPATDYGNSSRGAPKAHGLELGVKATAFLSDEYFPALDVRWSTSVDAALFQRELNKTDSLRDGSRSQDGVVESRGHATAGNAQPSSLSTTNMAGFDLTFTISGPDQVYVGEIFQWSLFVVNRSDKARSLAMLVVPKRRRADIKQHQSRVSSSSAGVAKESQVEVLAEAVLDNNLVYAMQKSGFSEPAELVSLSPDIRIGPLAPGACYTTDMRFLALAAGVLHIDSLRVIDLTTKETTDIRDLPDIVATERDSVS